MSQENPGSSSFNPANLPVKRKRGRPRKDESVVYAEKPLVPFGIDAAKGNQHHQVDPTDDENDIMVGQVVSGVIEGSFDAGYLLTVTVGDTNNVLRGVVFEPGLTVPVSAANDVAPNVKMVKRSQVPFPGDDIQTQMHGSPSLSKQWSERPVEPLQKNENLFSSLPVDQVPRVTPEVLPVQLKTGLSVTKGSVPNNSSNSQSAPSLQQAEIKLVSSTCPPIKELPGDTRQAAQFFPEAAEFQSENRSSTGMLLRNESGFSSEGDAGSRGNAPLVMPQQTVHFELEKQSTFVSESSESNRTVNLAGWLQNEASAITEESRNAADAPKDSLLEPKSEPSIQNSETTEQIPQFENQALGCERSPDELVHDALEGPKPELDVSVVAVNPQTVCGDDPTSEPVKMQEENPASPNCDQPEELQPELSSEIPERGQTSRSNEGMSGNAIEMMAEALQSMPETNPLVETLQREAMPSSAHDLEAELAINQSVVSEQVVKPQISLSNEPTQEVPEPQRTQSDDTNKKEETTSVDAIFPEDSPEGPQQ